MVPTFASLDEESRKMRLKYLNFRFLCAGSYFYQSSNIFLGIKEQDYKKYRMLLNRDCCLFSIWTLSDAICEDNQELNVVIPFLMKQFSYNFGSSYGSDEIFKAEVEKCIKSDYEQRKLLLVKKLQEYEFVSTGEGELYQFAVLLEGFCMAVYMDALHTKDISTIFPKGVADVPVYEGGVSNQNMLKRSGLEF